MIACSWTLASASGDVSHVGWPQRDTVWIANDSGQVGIGTDGSDMLLGGAGSDTIYGGPGDDVIWGDRLPSPNGVDADDFTGSPTRWTFE